MVEDQEKNVPAVVEVADDGDARKEKKERHKKDKKHKHKHKHKSGHKRHREEEDGAEVETVPAAVKPGSSEPERRANGKVTHDVADKAGSDCESGEIPTAEDITGVANESGAAGDGDGPSAAGQPLGTDDGQGIDENGTERCGIQGHLPCITHRAVYCYRLAASFMVNKHDLVRYHFHRLCSHSSLLPSNPGLLSDGLSADESARMLTSLLLTSALVRERRVQVPLTPSASTTTAGPRRVTEH